jgi:hypothetical protein
LIVLVVALQADLLVNKSRSSLKKQVNYHLLIPSLLDHLATVKVDGGSKQGVHDWCHFYSKVKNLFAVMEVIS